ncbi:hypothetical protein Golob_025993 [Gossypium lobatum]|uniref:Uncharacterized protein n=1 Tax=Gossypium lobatum TaxID=34289 RepID=A0A7J8LTQ8_9ROSI|nr:hypothetical protein [Gossypium lobatum]MBA0555842.1 hypothetical protein [Gossypium lobatum]
MKHARLIHKDNLKIGVMPSKNNGRLGRNLKAEILV